MQQKAFFDGAVTKATTEGFDATFTISSSSVDRDGDRILPTALKSAAEAKSKLIALWQHKSDQPIGAWHNLRMVGNKLVADLRIAGSNLGLMIKALLADDVPLAASIGFMGGGSINEKGGIDWDDIELLECSVVSVPANADAQRREAALAVCKSFGLDPSLVIEQPEGPERSDRVSAAIERANRARAKANLMKRQSCH